MGRKSEDSLVQAAPLPAVDSRGSGSFLTGADDRLIHDFFRRWIPVESLAAAVRLRGHDYDNGGRESVIHVCVWLVSRAHGIKPVHDMNQAVVARTLRVRRFRAGHLNDFFLINCGTYDRHAVA